MKIKFWGVRGSIPCPGPHTVKYGGNTACIEICLENPDRRIILDAGSGIRELGNHLVASGACKNGLKADIFLSHTHWDHINGFPFFTPLYIPGTDITIHGPIAIENTSLEKIVGGQLTYYYFPVQEADLAAQITYRELKEGDYDLGDGLTMDTRYLNHPLLCLGYRFKFQGKILCTGYDTEPFKNIFCTDPSESGYDPEMAAEGEVVAQQENERIEQFFHGADLLIHDAQYTLQEYNPAKIGWGHTPVETAIETGVKSRVRRLALFHHDPMRTDQALDEMALKFLQGPASRDMDIFFAREGMEIII
jgi:phosphoribosyl 1,2-cyclic phosphodiesterase